MHAMHDTAWNANHVHCGVLITLIRVINTTQCHVIHHMEFVEVETLG